MQERYTYHTGRLMRAICLGIAVFTLSAACPTGLDAQPVDRYVYFEHPARSITYDASTLTGSKRRVAIVRSEQSMRVAPGAERLVEDAVYHWELLLLGLEIPYQILDDNDLGKRIPDAYQVLILPGVESLSAGQKQRILEYMASGRGLIASGRTGFYDEHGVSRGAGFMENAFDVDLIEDLPEQPHGMYQTIDAATMLSRGIPPGFLLNVHAQRQLSAVLPRAHQAPGTIKTFESGDQAAFDGATLMLLGASSDARFFWMRFQPQDIARDAGQQKNYQRLIVNALASFTGSRSVFVENWPSGHSMALTVSALPSPGFDPMSYLTNVSQFVDYASRNDVPVSYYLSSSEVTLFPGVFKRIIDSGAEIGLSSDTDRMLIADSTETQVERLLRALDALGRNQAHGVYPQGGFLGPNSIRALDQIGAAYVIESGGSEMVPGQLDWWKYADYRADFVAPNGKRGPASAAAENPPTRRLPQIATIPLLDDGSKEFLKVYNRIRAVAGYFFLPFYPELFRPYSSERNELDGILRLARRENVWIATASDVLVWWRKRANLRPEIVFSGENEMRIELQWNVANTLKGVVLDVHLPGVLQQNIHVSESGSLLSQDPEHERIRIKMDPLTGDGNHVVISWDR